MQDLVSAQIVRIRILCQSLLRAIVALSEEMSNNDEEEKGMDGTLPPFSAHAAVWFIDAWERVKAFPQTVQRDAGIAEEMTMARAFYSAHGTAIMLAAGKGLDLEVINDIGARVANGREKDEISLTVWGMDLLMAASVADATAGQSPYDLERRIERALNWASTHPGRFLALRAVAEDRIAVECANTVDATVTARVLELFTRLPEMFAGMEEGADAGESPSEQAAWLFKNSLAARGYV